jgi:glutathione S-transferase
MSHPEAGALRLERTFAASAEEVFDAWTNPQVLARWCGPGPSWTSPGCDVDLRIGGRYVLRMNDPESGRAFVVGGEYREIDRPRRLVYTWRWESDDSPDPGHVSLVSVDFVPAGEGTTVVLEHSGLPSESSRARHGSGWEGTFDNLARRVFGERSQQTSEELVSD